MQIRSARHGSGAWAWLLTCAHVCCEKALARLALRSASLRATALPFAATRMPCTPPWVACDLRCKDQGANRSAIGRARHSRARGRGALFARLDGAARQAQAQIHRQPSAAHSLKCAHRAGGAGRNRSQGLGQIAWCVSVPPLLVFSSCYQIAQTCRRKRLDRL